jgi:putative oxidoreductase
MRLEDLGKLILRLTVGGLLLMHGIAKVMDPNMAMGFIGTQLASHGLPDFIKYGVFLGEVAGPLLLILGFLTRLGALMIVVNMAMAIFLVNMDNVAVIKAGGAWAIEIEAFFLLGALAVFCLGAGRVSLRKGVPKVD